MNQSKRTNSLHNYAKMVNYCNFKEQHSKLYQQPGLKEIIQIGDDDIISVPPYRTKSGRRILIYRIGNWNPRTFSVDDLFKTTISILELAVLEPQAQVLGGYAIFDFKGISMSHAVAVTPRIAKMMVSLMITSFPSKIHEMHILNQSKIFDTIFAVFKPLLDSDMGARIIFHGNKYESLHQYISPDYLPKKYGGIRDEIPYYKWIIAVSKDAKILEEIAKVGYGITDEMREFFKL